MSTQTESTNSKPKAAPVIRTRNFDGHRSNFWRYLPAVIASILFHGLLVAAFIFLNQYFSGLSDTGKEEAPPKVADVPESQPDPPEESTKEVLASEDIDQAKLDTDTNLNFNNNRIENVSVPGRDEPENSVGYRDGAKDVQPTNIAPPPGFGGIGQGAGISMPGLTPNSGLDRQAGGYGNRPMTPGSFYGRGSGSTREQLLRDGGGTSATEAAVVRGLGWLERNQSTDGGWKLDGNFNDRGPSNDTAGTGFGLLPFLGAGHTHKKATNPKFMKPIEMGLQFLIRRQNKKTGDLGVNRMYGHAIATIAMCEAYGLSQDVNLRVPAQLAVNYLVNAQHSEGGGWRYSPGSAGDLSVTGWVVMALKSALMANLEVPAVTLRKAQRYLDTVCNSDNEGYGYVGGSGSTEVMTAVALLCRQYLQSWGPQNLRMIKGIDTYVKPNWVGKNKNVYFYYYATQVMHHFGGDAWKEWNLKMREHLVKTQDSNTNSAQFGSWSSAGINTYGGGRLMVTSLHLLSLEVYYRYLPLYYRESGSKDDMAVKGGL